MKENYFTIIAIIGSLGWYLLKAKKKKPYVILGAIFGIILELEPSILSSDKKLGILAILSGLVGLYDLTYLQKVKGVWPYMLVLFGTGLCILIRS